MEPTKQSSVPGDAEKLLDYIHNSGIDPNIPAPDGWKHMGAIVCDAVLQRRLNYETTVEPRIKYLISNYLNGVTTKDLLDLIKQGKLSEAIKWSGDARLTEIEQITSLLSALGIDTWLQLKDSLASEPNRSEVRAALGAINFVGPKTLDYFDILVGIPGTAIDSNISKVATFAGIEDLSYQHLHDVVTELSSRTGWNLRNLDHALWNSKGAV